jgi:hypothetical protein
MMILLAGLLALMNAFSLPDLEGPDEINHAACVQSLACDSPYFPLMNWGTLALRGVFGETPSPLPSELTPNDEFKYFANTFYFKESYRGEIIRNTSVVLSRMTNVFFVTLVFIIAAVMLPLEKAKVLVFCLIFPGINAYIGKVNPDWLGLVFSWLFFLTGRYKNGSLFVNILLLFFSYVFFSDRSSIFFVCTYLITAVLIAIPCKSFFRIALFSVFLLPFTFEVFSKSISEFWGLEWRTYGELSLSLFLLSTVTTSTAFFFADGAQSILSWVPFYMIFFTGSTVLLIFIGHRVIQLFLNPQNAKRDAAYLVIAVYFTVWVCALVINPSFKIGRFFFYVMPAFIVIFMDLLTRLRCARFGTSFLLFFFFTVTIFNVTKITFTNPVPFDFFRNSAMLLGLSR